MSKSIAYNNTNLDTIFEKIIVLLLFLLINMSESAIENTDNIPLLFSVDFEIFGHVQGNYIYYM